MSRLKLRGSLVGALIVSLLLLMSVTASAQTVSVGDISLKEVGDTGSINVVLDEVPSDGFAYANVSVSINPPVAKFVGVSFPGWAALSQHSPLPPSVTWFKVGDLNNQVQAGDTNVVLATLTVERIAEGDAGIGITLNSVQRDGDYKEIKNSISTSSGSISVEKTTPSAPQNLQATAGDGKIVLTWNAPIDNGGSSITGYKVYRGTGAGKSVVAIVKDTSYTDTGLTNGQTYYYQVSAVNSVGEGPLSDEVRATPIKGTVQPAVLVLDSNNPSNVENGMIDLLKEQGYSPVVIGVKQVENGEVSLSDYKVIVVPTYSLAIDSALESDKVRDAIIDATNSGTNWILFNSGCKVLEVLDLATVKVNSPPGWVPALPDSQYVVNATTDSPITSGVPSMPDWPGGYSLKELDNLYLDPLIWRVDNTENSRYKWLHIDDIIKEPTYLIYKGNTGWHINKPHKALPEWTVGNSHILFYHHFWNADPGNGGGGTIGPAGKAILKNAVNYYAGNITNQPPIASFTYSPENPVVNQPITFDASGSYDPDGKIVKYWWNVSGTVYTAENFSHTFTTSGRKYVSLQVEDDEGETNSTVKWVNITPSNISLIFEDNFSELNLSKWIKFGYPSPKVLGSVYERDGVFDNNGDSWCPSGVVSRDALHLTPPFTIESDVYLDLQDKSGCWAGAGFRLYGSNEYSKSGSCANDQRGIDRILQMGVGYIGDACWAFPEEHRRHAYLSFGFLTEDGEWAGKNPKKEPKALQRDDLIDGWHNYKVKVDKQGYVSFYVDDELIYNSTEKIDLSKLENCYLWLGSRSSGSAGKAYHDYIKIERTPTGDTPSAPQNLQATSGDNKVALTWRAPADDGGSPITGYKVYRGTGAGKSVVAIVSDTSYTDTGLTNGQAYYYQVSAVNSVGEGTKSSEVSATPEEIPTSSKVTRELPSLAKPHSTFNVTIESTASTIGMELIEVIPDGLTFVDYSCDGAQVDFNINGNTLTFTATDMASDGFTINYTLQAPDNGTYTFSGTCEPMGGELKAIGGDNQLLVSRGETNPDNVPNDMEMVVSKYSDFNWATQTPTKSDVVNAVTNAVGQYFQADTSSEKQEIVSDVTQMVQLYFQLD